MDKQLDTANKPELSADEPRFATLAAELDELGKHMPHTAALLRKVEKMLAKYASFIE